MNRLLKVCSYVIIAIVALQTSHVMARNFIAVPQKGVWTDWKFNGGTPKFVGGMICNYKREFYPAIGNDVRVETKRLEIPKGMHCPMTLPSA